MRLLLAIDIGNTNVHLGLRDLDAGAWCCTWRAQTVHHRMSDEYAVLLHTFFEQRGYVFEQVEAVVIASVVPALTATFTEMSERYLSQTPLIVTHEVNSGVEIRLDNPAEIGPDRIVNAAAVNAQMGGPAIVIDFGTATTFDVIDAEGCYIGGAITTGIGLAHDALVGRAARLLNVDLSPPPAAIGRNTVHAMQSGLFLGYVAMIEGMVARIKAELGEPDVRVIATGGLAPVFAEQTDAIEQIAPDLTLEGLRVIWELNQKT